MTHLVETQGLLSGLQPRRHKNSKRKQGQDNQDLERADGSVRIDPEGKRMRLLSWTARRRDDTRALRLVRFFFSLFSSNFVSSA